MCTTAAYNSNHTNHHPPQAGSAMLLLSDWEESASLTMLKGLPITRDLGAEALAVSAAEPAAQVRAILRGVMGPCRLSAPHSTPVLRTQTPNHIPVPRTQD